VAAIPREFYEKNVNFYGQIKGIDGGNSKVIFVEHLPILQLKKWKSENEFLRLEIPGLEFTQLTTNLDLIKNRNIKIKFTLLEINERNQAAMCLVYHRVKIN
jgi:hypothetical protein